MERNRHCPNILEKQKTKLVLKRFPPIKHLFIISSSVHGLVHALVSVELCKTLGDSFRLFLFHHLPMPPTFLGGFPIWSGKCRAGLQFLHCVWLSAFIPSIINVLQGWGEGQGNHGHKGSLIMYRGSVGQSSISRAREANLYLESLVSWKFQLLTELGGVICTGLKIKPNETETKKAATKVKCGKWGREGGGGFTQFCKLLLNL